jgi:hypothetical protein
MGKTALLRKMAERAASHYLTGVGASGAAA